jgi:hypothetical protein
MILISFLNTVDMLRKNPSTVKAYSMRFECQKTGFFRYPKGGAESGGKQEVALELGRIALQYELLSTRLSGVKF